MNILESLRKIENKIYREQDKSIDLQGMYLKEDVDKEKLWEMINKNDIDGIIKYLTEDLYTVKYSYYTDGDFTDRDIVDGEKTFTDAQEASQFSNSIKKAVRNNLIDLRWDIQDENSNRDWELIDKKTVHDWDGFTTDYTLWKKNGEDYWVCVFGDSDIYGPEDGDFDVEFNNEREALEWFRYYDDEYEQYYDDGMEETLTEGIELLDSDELEKYRDTQSQDRDYIGKKLWKDVQSVKELIPEATEEEAALIEKIVRADDEELYRTEDGTIIVAVLSDNDFGYEDAKQYIEDMKFQYK